MSYHEVAEWTDDLGRRVVQLVGSERQILDAIAPDVRGARWPELRRRTLRRWRLRKLHATDRNIAHILLSARQHCFLCRGRCPRCGNPDVQQSGMRALGRALVPEIKSVDHVAADAIVCSNDDCDYRIELFHRLET